MILHGIFGLSDNWATIGRRLAERFEVYIPDQRNHGQSPHSDTFNYYALTDDLTGFLDDRQIMKATLIGHSMGGKVAMNFALERPSRVDRLVVIDISTRKYPGRQQHIEILNTMMSVDFDKVETREDIEKMIAGKIPSERIRQFILKNVYRLGKKRLAWRLNAGAIYDNLENVFEGIASPLKFNKPALFIKGGRSEYITREDYELIRKNFPAAEFRVIEQASHWIHADAPDELCTILSDYLGKECEFRPGN